MFDYFINPNHDWLFLAIIVLGAIVFVAGAIAYFMQTQFLKEKQKRDPNFKKPDKSKPVNLPDDN